MEAEKNTEQKRFKTTCDLKNPRLRIISMNQRECRPELPLLNRIFPENIIRILSTDDLLRSLVDRLPKFLFNAGDVGARIVIENRQYSTKHFDRRNVFTSSQIQGHGEIIGKLELCCYSTPSYKQPLNFPQEGRMQLERIANEIGLFYREAMNNSQKYDPGEIYRITLASISDAVFITDDEGIFTFICSGTKKIFGYTYHEVFEFESVHDLLGKDIFPLRDLESRGEIKNIEIIIRDSEGNEHTILINVKRVNIEGGTHLYTCHDISKLKEAEKAASQLASIVESSYDAIIGMDTDGTIVSWNSGASDIYRYTLDEVMGQPIQMLIPPEKSQEVVDVLNRIKNCERLEQYTTIRMKKDGSRFDASVTLSPIKDKQDEVIGVSAIIRDISPQKKAERDLRDAYEKLETERMVLKEILGHIEEDKKMIEDQIQSNFNRIVMPLLHSIKEKSGTDDTRLLDLLEKSLIDITAPFINKLDANFSKLSPREVVICNMIRNGLPSKEIAQSLNISPLTVHKFRQQIRKKLGLAGKYANLSSFLKTL